MNEYTIPKTIKQIRNVHSISRKKMVPPATFQNSHSRNLSQFYLEI